MRNALGLLIRKHVPKGLHQAGDLVAAGALQAAAHVHHQALQQHDDIAISSSLPLSLLNTPIWSSPMNTASSTQALLSTGLGFFAEVLDHLGRGVCPFSASRIDVGPTRPS